MKKILFFGMMAALLLGTASCSSDMEPSMGDDMVRFTIELPGNIDSRAIADGLTATDLTVAVYDNQNHELDQIRKTHVVMQNRMATVEFKLVKGQTYSFAFWAQAEGAPYTFTPATKTVSVSYENAKSNDEKRDAFYAYRADVTVTGPISETITLYRPFCQLNYGASDYQDAIKAGVNATKSAVTVNHAATAFNLETGATTGDQTVTFTKELLPNEIEGDPNPDKLNVNDTDYDWMAMNYFLVPNNEATIETSLKLYEGDAEAAVRDITVPNVPVQKNHRTNIVGNLFTEDVNFLVIIDEHFDQPDYNVNTNGEQILTSNMTTEKINELIARGGNFALEGDLDLTAPIVVPTGATATLNLNGHKIYNTNDIYEDGVAYELISVEGGNLTINGNGQVIGKENDCYCVSVWDGSVVINGGDYSGNVSALYVFKGHAEINDGSFTIQQLPSGYNDYRYELNLYDANGKNGTASIVVYGGKYYQFDPANNLAENPQVNFLGQKEGEPTRVTELENGWYVVKSAGTEGTTEEGGDF